MSKEDLGDLPAEFPIIVIPSTCLAGAGWRINTLDVNWRGKSDQAQEVTAIRTSSQEMREQGVRAVTLSSILQEGNHLFTHLTWEYLEMNIKHTLYLLEDKKNAAHSSKPLGQIVFTAFKLMSSPWSQATCWRWASWHSPPGPIPMAPQITVGGEGLPGEAAAPV